MIEGHQLPVVVSAGQVTEHDKLGSALDLAEKAASIALEGAPGLRKHISRLVMVNSLSQVGPAPASELATRLGMEVQERSTTTIGGNNPQWLVNSLAQQIALGDLEAAMIVGTENMHSSKVARRTGSSFASYNSDLSPDKVIGDTRNGTGPAEEAIGLIAPVHIYALFESSIAARLHRDFPQQREEIAKWMATFTQLAARNRYAWFQRSRLPQELATPTSENRLVAEPYTKLLTAFLGVDQAAALVLTSLDLAKQYHLEESSVFIWSGADANDIWYPTARPDPGRSPAMKGVFTAALTAAGLSVGDISAFDLYSCFPCAVEMASEALGLNSPGDRVLTLTGGLAYFGGPGNNYTTHAIACAAEHVREHGGPVMISGLGWYATKHSAGIYSDLPPPRGFRLGNTLVDQERIDADSRPIVTGLDTHCPATVIASTIAYARDGRAVRAPIIARLEDGSQLSADIAEGELDNLPISNLVGHKVFVGGRPLSYRLVE
ncbi:MAG: acetyl-CoA acetyltransferase [Actinobacteria bacterium]|nr:acetyl-CoA acetyltransferase [Actinomycetota bacterium]MCL6094684.1 acetyl-CoA acetyltransferase [Actinomycetota bacterium]